MNTEAVQSIIDRLFSLSDRIDRFDGEYASTEPLRNECRDIANDLCRLTIAEVPDKNPDLSVHFCKGSYQAQKVSIFGNADPSKMNGVLE